MDKVVRLTPLGGLVLVCVLVWAAAVLSIRVQAQPTPPVEETSTEIKLSKDTRVLGDNLLMTDGTADVDACWTVDLSSADETICWDESADNFVASACIQATCGNFNVTTPITTPGGFVVERTANAYIEFREGNDARAQIRTESQDNYLEVVKGGTSQVMVHFANNTVGIGRDDTTGDRTLLMNGNTESFAYDSNLGNINADSGFTFTDPISYTAAIASPHKIIEVYDTDWPPSAAAYLRAQTTSTTLFQMYAMGGYEFDVGQPSKKVAMNTTKQQSFTAFMYGELNALGQGTCSTTTSTICWEDGDCPGGEHCDNGSAAIYEGALHIKAEGNPPYTCAGSRAGALYYDTNNAIHCYCDGSSWKQLDDGSTACN